MVIPGKLHLHSSDDPGHWNGLKLADFCQHMIRTDAWQIAYGRINNVRWLVDTKSDLRHEFLVLEGQIQKQQFWVRFDRSATDRGRGIVWEASDTVSHWFVASDIRELNGL